MTTHHQHYINGAFVADHNDKWIEVINPATEALLSRIPQGNKEDAQRAILAAEAAQPAWESLPAVERGLWLHKIATAIRAREPQLTATIVAEGGKTQGLAQTEVLFTADYLDYVAEWARRYEGEIINSDRANENIFLFKKAIGVTTGILPWNFPFFLIARKAAPALITGNTIVIKPSELTPNNAAIFAEILQQIELPAGVINFVYGYGPEVGQELAANPKVGLVSLTGSVGAGIATMQAAAKNVTKV